MAKSAQEMRQDVRTVREFMSAAERAGIVLPPPLKVAVAAFEAGTDVGVAFEDVCEQLQQFEHDFERSLALKYDMRDFRQADQAAIEEAAYQRLYQKRAVNAVLNLNNDQSVTARVWREWKPKIQQVMADHTGSMVERFLDWVGSSRR